MVAVPNIVEANFLASVTRHTRRVDIYETDGITPWLLDAPVTQGSVTVDYTRDERRSFDLTFDNIDGAVSYSPDGFWYDKVLKIWRGLEYTDDSNLSQAWEIQIGEFVIDGLKEQHFPTTVAVTGRDYTKRMLTSKFVVTTAFNEGASLDALINSIAANAGIPAYKRFIPPTGVTLGKDFIFDRGTTRWEACKQMADAYGYELYFDNTGTLVMRQYLDPSTSPLSYTFETGTFGNLVTYEKSVSDGRLYNHVVVSGEASDVTIPVWAEARNDNPASPTNIALIGDRLYQYVSSFITTTAQAQAVANRFLSIHSLQEYDFNFSSLMLPWLEVGEIIEFIDPKANDTQPDRFLLSNLTIPLGLGAMSGTGQRVTILG